MNELAILLLQAAVAAMKATPGAVNQPASQQTIGATQTVPVAPVQPQTSPSQPQTSPAQPQTAPDLPQTALVQPQTAPVQPQRFNEIPPTLQQLIQQMNREGAQFDMPPAGPSVYDRLSEHLAGLYSNSGTTSGNTAQ